MLERIFLLEKYVKTCYALLDLETKNIPKLTSEDWKIIRELTDVLQPLEEFTGAICGEKYPMASKIIAMVDGLFNYCNEASQLSKDTFSKKKLWM